MQISEIFEQQFQYRSFYSWDTDAPRNPARCIAATVISTNQSRMKMKFLLNIFLITSILLNCSGNTSFQNGDIIFQTSKSSQSKAIQLATGSKYSHMGIIYEVENKFYVYEAVQPVKITPLDDWIDRGEDDHYVVKRLKNHDNVLSIETLKKMKLIGERFKGKNYDLYFNWSDDRIYCSELVWKIYNEATGIQIGKLQKLKEFDLTNPVVKTKIKERYGENIPADELVISPIQMYDSELLFTVSSN